MNDKIRVFSKLRYGDCKEWLLALSEIEAKAFMKDLPEKERTLRTNLLKRWNQSRQAALFCYGISKIIASDVYFAIEEQSDFDCVASWKRDDEILYTPIQLKELVPNHLNKNDSLEKIISKLKKYPDSKDLTVAIYINKVLPNLELNTIKVSKNLNIQSLWLFGCTSSDKKSWFLYGDLLDNPMLSKFDYPTK